MKSRPALWIGLGLLGTALILWPWFYHGPQPMPAARSFSAVDPVYDQILAAAREVDTACRGGELRRLRGLVTPAALERLQRRLADAGRSLDSANLQGQFLIGSLDRDLLLAAGAAKERAVLVYRRDRVNLEQSRFLSGVTFRWDGYRWRFDEVSFRRLRTASAVEAGAAANAPVAAPANGAQSRPIDGIEASARGGDAIASQARTYLQALLDG